MPFLGTAKSDNRLTVNDCRFFLFMMERGCGRCGCAQNDSLIAGAPCFFVFLGFFGVKMFIFVVLKIMCNECYVHAVGLGCGVALNFNSGSQQKISAL